MYKSAIILIPGYVFNFTKCSPPKRHLFQWVNIIFNKVDEGRRRQYGPDRTCAEWILRNGGAVKWVNNTELLTDYNSIPLEGTKLRVQEVDATGSTIMHYGFPHFVGCHHIEKLILHKCSYLEDAALGMLKPLNDSLKFLQISSCGNITTKGIQQLKDLSGLKELKLFDLPYVQSLDSVKKDLDAALPNCTIQ